MTDTRIAEITARCEAATLGPWGLEVKGNTVKSFAIPGVCSGMKYDGANASFIANSREDIPYLLSRLATVTTERDRLKKEMDWLPARGLPQKDGRYLVVCKYPCICYYSNDREKINKYEMAGAGAGFYDISGEWGYYPIEDVSYWMEIPKLPVEEEGEQK